MTNAATAAILHGQHDNGNPLGNPALLPDETATWLSTHRGSGAICGDLADHGIVIQWHNLELTAGNVFDLPRSPYPDGLELCLNLSGHGVLESAASRLVVEPLTAFILAPGSLGVRVGRKPGEHHRFLTIRFSQRFLREQLMVCEGALPSPAEAMMPAGNSVAPLASPLRLTPEHERLVSMLLRPQCDQGACKLRCKGIVLQLMADFLAKPCCSQGASCDRQQCLARERVRGVAAILQRDLSDPPTLAAIAREIGCSPFHLSRTFSREMGMTIPQFVRTLRMRYAAELLKSGKCNVTEVAMAVGYSSLSHFSRVFCEAVGSCPAAYSSQASSQTPTSFTVLRPDAVSRIAPSNRPLVDNSIHQPACYSETFAGL